MSNIYIPKKFKSIKIHKNPASGTITNYKLTFGFVGVLAKNYGHINARNLEAGRRFITKRLRRKSRVKRKVSLTQPITSKPKLARMGKGKGKLRGWIGYVKPGTLLFEMGFTSTTALLIAKIYHKEELSFENIKQKFQFPIKIVKKNYKINSHQKNEVRFYAKNKKRNKKKISNRNTRNKI
jgi:large subunit ribosomal protein L16